MTRPKAKLTWIAERMAMSGGRWYTVTIFDAATGETLFDTPVRAESDGELQCKADILVIEAGER